MGVTAIPWCLSAWQWEMVEHVAKVAANEAVADILEVILTIAL